MCTLKKYSFHFRENYRSGGFRNHFVDADAYNVEQAKEISIMGRGIKRFEDLEFIKDLSDFSVEDLCDYMIIHDRTGNILPVLEPRYIEANRNVKIKDLLDE